MRVEVQRIAVRRLANICGLIYAAICVPFALCVATFDAAILTEHPDISVSGTAFALTSVAAGGAVGWLLGAFAAVVYNQLARRLGGIRLDVRVDDAGEPPDSVA